MPSGEPLQPAPRANGFRILRNLSIFTGAFVLATWGLHVIAPDDLPRNIQAKLGEFERQKDQYDAIFIGSSEVFRQVSPGVFATRTRQHGSPVRAYNFGFAGMFHHESGALLKVVLAKNPARLRWVLAELFIRERLEIDEANRFKPRAVWWHNVEETRSVCRDVLRHETMPTAEKVRCVGDHWLHCGAKYTHLGEGPRWILAAAGRSKKRPHKVGESGFIPLGDSLGEYYQQRREKFVAEMPRYRRLVRARPCSTLEQRDYYAEDLQRRVELVRRFGAEPVFFVPPWPYKSPGVANLQQRGVVPVVLEFNRPDEYPGLFAVANRFDFTHLNIDGSKNFTRLLADRFSQLSTLRLADERPRRPREAGGTLR